MSPTSLRSSGNGSHIGLPAMADSAHRGAGSIGHGATGATAMPKQKIEFITDLAANRKGESQAEIAGWHVLRRSVRCAGAHCQMGIFLFSSAAKNASPGRHVSPFVGSAGTDVTPSSERKVATAEKLMHVSRCFLKNRAHPPTHMSC